MTERAPKEVVIGPGNGPIVLRPDDIIVTTFTLRPAEVRFEVEPYGEAFSGRVVAPIRVGEVELDFDDGLPPFRAVAPTKEEVLELLRARVIEFVQGTYEELRARNVPLWAKLVEMSLSVKRKE